MQTMFQGDERMSDCNTGCGCKRKLVMLDINATSAKSSGYYVRSDLLDRIKRIEEQTDSKVIGIVFEDSYTIELILDPPIGVEEE